jgi:uncharacterized protein
MSSTERAPEPTMEEILASIRRIISDDEANNSARQSATNAEDSGQVMPEDPDEEAADTQIIDDIARVLSGGSAPAGGDDDILDLTDPSGAVSEAAGEPIGFVATAAEELIVAEDLVLQTEVYTEARTPPNFAAAFPPAYQDVAEAPQEIAEAPQEIVQAPQEIAEAPQEIAEVFASEAVSVSDTKVQSEVPTSALERAIAALKAGDLSAFAREAQSDYVLTEAAQATPQAEPIAEPSTFEPEATLVVLEEKPLALEEPPALSEPEPELGPAAWSAESPSWPKSESTPEPEVAAAPWRSEELSWGQSGSMPQFQPSPPRVNGGSARKRHEFEAATSAKTLEDSVKEMLRPLLRQWLDDNMPRVLTAALREELENSEEMRRGS